jgi:hypothetical protein
MIRENEEMEKTIEIIRERTERMGRGNEEREKEGREKEGIENDGRENKGRENDGMRRTNEEMP